MLFRSPRCIAANRMTAHCNAVNCNAARCIPHRAILPPHESNRKQHHPPHARNRCLRRVQYCIHCFYTDVPLHQSLSGQSFAACSLGCTKKFSLRVPYIPCGIFSLHGPVHTISSDVNPIAAYEVFILSLSKCQTATLFHLFAALIAYGTRCLAS